MPKLTLEAVRACGMMLIVDDIAVTVYFDADDRRFPVWSYQFVVEGPEGPELTAVQFRWTCAGPQEIERLTAQVLGLTPEQFAQHADRWQLLTPDFLGHTALKERVNELLLAETRWALVEAR